MRLTVIGSADASNGAGRGHSCYWLDGAGSLPLMVDFGGTALQGLRRCGRTPGELGGILFTHLHGDHTGGYPYLHVDAMYTSFREAELDVLGPPGTRERLETLVAAHYGRLAEREADYATRWTEVAPGEEAEVLGARVAAFPAQHMSPPEQPLCLRVTGRDGAVVAFSGDTQLCPGLFAAAEGADLLVAECSALAPPAGKHSTWAEWLPRLPDVSARRLLLTHLGAEVRARIPELLAQAPPGLDLAFADDGLELEITPP